MQSSSGFDSGVISVFRLKNGYQTEEEADFRFDKNVLFDQKYRNEKYSLLNNHVKTIVIYVI